MRARLVSVNTLLQNALGKEGNVVIGALHFPPLPPLPAFPGFKVAEENAFRDLAAFEKGGVDAVIFENNYDDPHKTFVDEETAAAMHALGKILKEKTKVPLGVSVLWNDYKTALSIAQELSLSFIRVPVFVDAVRAVHGVIKGPAREVSELRNSTSPKTLLFTDIHVKHAELLSSLSLTQSAKAAVAAGSNALIVTGAWTGEAPNLKDLQSVRDAVGDFPILAGSGTTAENIAAIFSVANGAIVSTSLKEGAHKEGEKNVKGYEQRIDVKKVQALIAAVRK